MRFIQISKEASPDIKNLLATNIIGTPGSSMVYQHQTVSEKLDHLSEPFFVSLYLRNALVGTCCFCKRQVYLGGELTTAYYIRYFTFKATFRSSARPKVYQPKRSRLKREVEQLLRGEGFNETKPHVYYAYIDPDNIRSLRLTREFDFEPAGLFHTVYFSRFFPRRNKNVIQVHEKEKKLITSWLKKTYSEYQFFGDENIFYRDGYFAIKYKGEIVAGLQAISEKWKIFELPGKNGKMLLSVISRVPLLRRLFNREFKFLSIEAILCKPGHERELEYLLSDVLARHRVNTAILCLDPASSAYKMIKSLKPGAMSRLAAEKRLQVIARYQQMEKPSGQLSYVSAFDVM